MSPASAARSTMSIGEVLAALRPEFPDVTISKIRFLEGEGLIRPARAPSGYRQFSPADVERLRFVLAAQRDHYLPLRVIKEQLSAMDRDGQTARLPGPGVRMGAAWGDGVDRGGASAAGEQHPGVGRSRAELIEQAGIEPLLVDELEEFGLLHPRPGAAPYDEADVTVARYAGRLAAFGLRPRHLRPVKIAAEREAGLVEQVVAPLRRGQRPESAAHADEIAREVAALSISLHAALLRAGLHRDANQR